MAKTGRIPKPIEEKIHDGTLRPRDVQTPLVVGGRNPPSPPKYLDEEQTRCFRRIVRELRDAGILDRADRGMVELAAIEEANVIACNEQIKNDGRYIEYVSDRGAVNMRENPAVDSQKKSIASLRQIYGELGIGPANRARFGKAGTTTTKETRERNIPGLDKARALKVVSIDNTTRKKPRASG